MSEFDWEKLWEKSVDIGRKNSKNGLNFVQQSAVDSAVKIGRNCVRIGLGEALGKVCNLTL